MRAYQLVVGRKAKATEAMRQIKAAMWFQCSFSPWKSSMAMTVKTVREITSWMIFI